MERWRELKVASAKRTWLCGFLDERSDTFKLKPPWTRRRSEHRQRWTRTRKRSKQVGTGREGQDRSRYTVVGIFRVSLPPAALSLPPVGKGQRSRPLPWISPRPLPHTLRHPSTRPPAHPPTRPLQPPAFPPSLLLWTFPFRKSATRPALVAPTPTPCAYTLFLNPLPPAPCPPPTSAHPASPCRAAPPRYGPLSPPGVCT